MDINKFKQILMLKIHQHWRLILIAELKKIGNSTGGK